jgi:ABC-type uncharacterized transport system permease subunit
VPILLVIAPLLAVLLYLLSWVVAARSPHADTAPEAQPLRFDAGSWLMLAGMLAHAASLFLAMHRTGALRFGFGPALSGTFLVGAALLWLEGLSARVEALRSVVLPIAATTCLLPLIFPGVEMPADEMRPLLLPHLLIGTLAYGVLMLSALHAALMTAAERSLHGHEVTGFSPFARWIERLPPLLVLERILFRFIAIGFILLLLTALSGVLFSEQVFGRPFRFDHKTLFSLIALGMFGVLLFGRARWGWRGRTALRLTVSGFVVLLLAYVGSRFVLEVILGRG